MRPITLAMILVTMAGCAQAPSAPRVAVPPPERDVTPIVRDSAPAKPMPQDVYEMQLPPPPFEDAPLVNQPTPEQSAFIDTYNRVGRPRISIVVDGASQKRTDEWARSFDDEAIRNVLTDWLACNGQVTLVTLSAANDGTPAAQDTDVIVHIQAHPTQQYADGLRIRLLAEASNTKDGVSIGRAFVDVPPPLEKTQINRYTRWLARKLMDDMTASWLAPEPGNPGEKPAPPSPAPPSAAPRSPTAPQTQPPATTTPER